MGVILKYGQPVTTWSHKMKDGEAIKAGLLIELDSTPEWVKVGAAADQAVVVVAAERENLDKETAYANGEYIVGLVNPPGFLGILASGQNVAKGAPLEAAANGELTAATVTQAVDEAGSATYTISHSRIVGHADEAVNASGGAKRIRVITA